jgi:MarC family membrane protein
MATQFDSFWSAVVLLILVTDPLGNIPLVIRALSGVAPERRMRVILREVLIAFGILLVFMFAGNHFLRLMGLSETSLGIGGGVVLFLIALRMIFPSRDGVFGDATKEQEPFIVPLAIPFIAGPSALATVLLLVSREPDRVSEWVAALALALTVSAVVLSLADRIQNWLGAQVTRAFESLMGLVLVAISIEMLMTGIRQFVATLGT